MKHSPILAANVTLLAAQDQANTGEANFVPGNVLPPIVTTDGVHFDRKPTPGRARSAARLLEEAVTGRSTNVPDRDTQMNRTVGGLLIVVFAAGLVGCDGQNVTAPTPRQTLIPPTSGGPTLTGVTLFGVVTETTPNGQTPVTDVSIYCDACGEFGHSWARTDGNGYYSFSGDLEAGGGIWLSAGATLLLVDKEGYQSLRAVVDITQDTRFDIQLVR